MSDPWFVNQFAENIFTTKYAGDTSTLPAYFHFLSNKVAQGNKKAEAAYYNMLTSKRFLPGGRILAWAGRIKSSVSLMNCTTHKIQDDSLEAINRAAYAIMRASSRGQGIGINLDVLRPKDAPVNNAAKTSTGAISFMEMLAAVGRTIGQEGRRAALLFSLNVKHPDIWRKDRRDIECPRCLGKGCLYCKHSGYISYDFLHVKTLPGRVENANISLSIDDAFMRNVKLDMLHQPEFFGSSGDSSFIFKSPAYPAKELFSEVARSAWASAEPGVLFWDNSIRASNSDLFGFPVVGVNACSEQVLDHEGVCNLGSLNLYAFVMDPFTSNAKFNFNLFRESVLWAVHFLDSVIDLELSYGFQISFIQQNSLQQLRRIGLGVMGLADAMAALGIIYGSDDSVLFVHEVFSILRDTAYEASIRLAAEHGAAPIWDNADRAEVIRHGFYSTLPDRLKEGILKWGTRNITLLSVAPTGTISNLLGVSSGIEPIFATRYIRRVKMSGKDEFVEYAHPGYLLALKNGREKNYITTYDVDVAAHLDIHAAAQLYVDQSISKTVNLPSSATPTDIENIYTTAWSLGIKGITVYRDGSRDEQILYTESTTAEHCPVCGNGIEHKEGCKSCTSCGWSVCSV